MPKAYNPHEVEERIYAWWESKGYFTPKVDWSKKPFVISIPPPNITGELHHGHAMFIAFEDLMIRWHRMRGEPTLWLPGTDHAGIATQNVVEKELAKQGRTRHDLGREQFVKSVWAWRAEYGSIITHQLRRMGASADWTRERFTLDDGLSSAVRFAFVQLYKKGLIYRGDYLVNWCPRCETAISDLEVDHEEEQGKLYYVRYLLEPQASAQQTATPGNEYIAVATTRPETILGDTAVAVNPHDQRYTALVGRSAILPALGRRIPIIADPFVDPLFGTGAVKVTPGHDPNDYEMGQRHGLPTLSIMNKDATINAEGGPYAGLERYAAREQLVADLTRDGLLVKVEEHTHKPGRCQRCGTMIEPLISTQWFVKIKPLAEAAITAVKDGRIRIIPERFERIYYNWMENIRDWCISRQLWWGHRIPVWYCDDCGGQTCEMFDATTCVQCGSSRIRQDPDVLDTWFSSGLWPFSTLGWPDDTEDMRYFYPTSVLETGYDILFFWVARMIMLGLECTGDIPFHTVYLHGLMRDEKGEKMSKSKGNTANPLDVVRDYGADALRFTIVTGSTPGNDMKLYSQKLEMSRNFANKIWNAARFVVSSLESVSPAGIEHWTSDKLALADRWILSRLNRLIANVNRLLENFQFGEAGHSIYEFLWDEFCDWYIEIAKVRLYGKDAAAQATTRRVLAHVLDRALRLLHPFMPFVTEEIWQRLKQIADPSATLRAGGRPQTADALMVAEWPEPGPIDEAAEYEFGLIMELVRGIRNARAEYDVDPARRIAATIATGEHTDLLTSQADILAALARVDPAELHIQKTLRKKPAQAVTLVAGDAEVYLPLAGLVDLDKERTRLSNELTWVERDIARTEALLANVNFTAKAPAAVVEKERGKLVDAQARRDKLQARLKALA